MKPEVREKVLRRLSVFLKMFPPLLVCLPIMRPIVRVIHSRRRPSIIQSCHGAWVPPSNGRSEKKMFFRPNRSWPPKTSVSRTYRSESSLLMFWLGATDPQRLKEANEKGTRLPGLHSSEFYPQPEPAIRTGVDSHDLLGARSAEEVSSQFSAANMHGFVTAKGSMWLSMSPVVRGRP